MNLTCRRGVPCAALVAALTLVSVQAFGQDHAAVPAQPLDQSLQGAARSAYTYAKILFDNGDFAGALAKYTQAYGLSKDPRLLFNMALCERNLRAYARMRTLLQRYETESGSALSARDKGAVDAALAAAENLVGKVTLSVDPPGATISVDGAVVGTAPLDGPLEIELGRHTVSAKKTGFEDTGQEIEVAGGAASSLAIHLAPQRSTTARLVVAVDPGAMVAIDGKAIALGRFDGPLGAGAHDVNVTEQGKSPYAAHVDLRDGETRTLDVTLLDEKPGGAVWPWIAGGVAVVAAGTVGGYFLFRTSPDHSAALSGQFATVHFSAFRGW